MAGAVIYEDPEDIPPVLPVVESPFKEAPAYDHLTPAQQENSWFTDGSATVEGGKRLWRAVAYQPHTETTLKQQGSCCSRNQPGRSLSENEDLCKYAEVNVIEPSLISLARWAHETSGHMGAEKTYQWCHQRCIPVTTDIVKQIVNNCSTCTEVKQWPLQKKATGKLKRGMGPGQIWQVDYIGPLPRENKLLYALTAVDTYSGLLQAYPSIRADQKATLNGLSHLIQAYGVPEEIQSDQGSHFAGRDVQEWAQGAGIQWTLHIPYHPQAAGLIERMNGLLKEQVKKLTGHNHLKGWTKVLKQALFNLNNHPLAGSTPFMRHQNVGGEPPVCALRLTTISPLANNELTPTGLLVRTPKSLTIKLNSSERLSLGITDYPHVWNNRDRWFMDRMESMHPYNKVFWAADTPGTEKSVTLNFTFTKNCTWQLRDKTFTAPFSMKLEYPDLLPLPVMTYEDTAITVTVHNNISVWLAMMNCKPDSNGLSCWTIEGEQQL
ncbi:uncharacterized protein LOC120519928, partial [Polypterus senegalus]|uniref:uncharacterized protein LOC120519928 n=1 Tax=Polypterus senegalus TaxID=55291 RepID=UPI001965CFBE